MKKGGLAASIYLDGMKRQRPPGAQSPKGRLQRRCKRPRWDEIQNLPTAENNGGDATDQLGSVGGTKS